MLKDLCDAINGIDELINAQVIGEEVVIKNNPILNTNCPVYIPSEGGQCIGHSAALISAFIGLLKIFENHDVDASEKDKLTQYAILWLSYKLKKNMKMEDGISDIYENIKHNNNKISEYDNYKEQINNLMNMDTKIITNFFDVLIVLCNIFTKFYDDTTNCTKCLQDANKFVAEYDKLNDDSNNTEGSSHRKILTVLSTDYDIFKKKCNDDGYNDIPFLPPIKTTKKYIESSIQFSEVILSSSPIASKLIPVLSIFFAIPIFFGIAYKYSLFGFDKRLQRQYLREKIKKIKKKMSQYI
ncbi:CIR protein [Plasmodium chabaudi chabaudi]|uniref:CIR protein n=2 Tax=Plasmodium chabaudi chabaudi TaxID=31271 RepID=A0A1D3L7T8_PLACU|nr:CIR protein [Plasmodium chabaudi chabaudi]